VFLAETQSKFNTRDSQGDILVDADGTIGIQVIEPNSKSKLSSIGHQIIAEHKKAATIAEEMRILYVAMTRGRERLILTGSAGKKQVQNILHKGSMLYQGHIPDWQVRLCRSPLEWILYALAGQKKLHDAFETGNNEGLADEDLFAVKLWEQVEPLRYKQGTQKTKRDEAKKPVKSSAEAQKKLSIVKASLGWRYPFSDSVSLKAKESVSRLTHSGDEFFLKDYSNALQRRPAAVETQAEISGFIDPKLTGLATHRVIEELDLGGKITPDAVSKTIEGLVSRGEISGPVAGQININSIVKFFDSEPGRMVLERPEQVLREWPFTLGMPAEELGGKQSGDIVIIQGIIDMLVQMPESLVIIDFKTDRIGAGQVEQRTQFYAKQINLYGRAAEAIMKLKLKDKWLYFLGPGCASRVK
jgi:ATP-dependent helicase/nuclease subunit A